MLTKQYNIINKLNIKEYAMIKEIQALRFWAIIFVIVNHLKVIIPDNYQYLYTKFRQIFHTSSGVELFFVIAGYFLMQYLSRQKLDTINEKSIFYLNLIIKKVRRLSPALYFWAIVILLMSVITNNQELWLKPSIMIQKFLATLSYLRNFEEIDRESLFRFSWAVSLEFQFFVIFPIIYLILGKSKTILLSAGLCLLMTFYRFGGEHFWWFRFDGMLFGVLCYVLVNDAIGIDNLKKSLNVSKISVFFISLMLIFELASAFMYLVNFPILKSSIASILSCIMLILALCNKNFFYPTIPIIKNVILWVGDRSYSLFCCHIPAWFVVEQAYISLHLDMKYMIFVQLAMMFIFADITYRLIENMFYKKTKL